MARKQPVAENKPDANDDPGKYYPPPDDQVPGGAPGAVEEDPVGMVRCRSCGMHTPADGTRCERCNSPVRG